LEFRPSAVRDPPSVLRREGWGGLAMSIDSTKAVFLSYASQDADAARKICEALRGAGVEVWFD
jgi:hypothetical protein